ncbi:hypothetical protein ACEWY4_017279 [Coilia grayii]|uniref:Immunoglobulin domain-containing protein n=1 Tax=Coilia grayii TaxID=363190 RepID=A0ABD1JIM9_9TELE
MTPKLYVAVFLLGVLWIVPGGVSPIEVTGVSGGSISIPCEYDVKYRGFKKYFCRGNPVGCEDLISTKDQDTEGRYSLFDDGEGQLLVRIKQLSAVDEGWYQCAVHIPYAWDKYTDVYITVTDGLSPSPAALEPVTPETAALYYEGPGTNSTTEQLMSPFNSTTPEEGKAKNATTPNREPVGHYTDKYHGVLLGIVGLIVVMIVAIILLGIVLCVKRAKSGDSDTSHIIPSSTPTAPVGP